MNINQVKRDRCNFGKLLVLIILCRYVQSVCNLNKGELDIGKKLIDIFIPLKCKRRIYR